MPTVGSFHDQYWKDTTPSTFVPPPPGPSVGGYAGWQAGVIVPSLFGVVGAWLDAQMGRLRWAFRLVRRVERLNAEQRAVLDTVIRSLESPAYPVARQAVRDTAQTLGFNRPEAWKPYSHELKASPGRAENTFRHLRACTLTRDRLREQGSTMTNPEMHLVVELGYQGFAAVGH